MTEEGMTQHPKNFQRLYRPFPCPPRKVKLWLLLAQTVRFQGNGPNYSTSSVAKAREAQQAEVQRGKGEFYQQLWNTLSIPYMLVSIHSSSSEASINMACNSSFAVEMCGLFGTDTLGLPFSSSQDSAFAISPIPISHVPKGRAQEQLFPIFFDPIPILAMVSITTPVPFPDPNFLPMPWQNCSQRAMAGQSSHQNARSKSTTRNKSLSRARSGRSEGEGKGEVAWEVPGEWISHNSQINDSRLALSPGSSGTPWGEKVRVGHG